jgi:hypothetical protein
MVAVPAHKECAPAFQDLQNPSVLALKGYCCLLKCNNSGILRQRLCLHALITVEADRHGGEERKNAQEAKERLTQGQLAKSNDRENEPEDGADPDAHALVSIPIGG